MDEITEIKTSFCIEASEEEALIKMSKLLRYARTLGFFPVSEVEGDYEATPWGEPRNLNV